jgi:hypothetical protein
MVEKVEFCNFGLKMGSVVKKRFKNTAVNADNY